MPLEELISIGFKEPEAINLAGSDGFHHKRKTGAELTDLFNKIADVYDITFKEVKKAILTCPQFAGYNHERVVREGVDVYGEENKDRFKKAILTCPQFAGYNHERVVRQMTRLGNMVGLSDEETISRILDLPPLAGYSVKRYLAGFDVARQLKKEGFLQDKDMLEIYFKCILKSPYVPELDRKRISQVTRGNKKEPSQTTGIKSPPLLIEMRRRLKTKKGEEDNSLI